MSSFHGWLPAGRAVMAQPCTHRYAALSPSTAHAWGVNMTVSTTQLAVPT